jgi:hypothetical protein
MCCAVSLTDYSGGWVDEVSMEQCITEAKDLLLLAIIQTMPFVIMWPRFVLCVRRSCALSHLPEVAVPRMSLA